MHMFTAGAIPGAGMSAFIDGTSAADPGNGSRGALGQTISTASAHPWRRILRRSRIALRWMRRGEDRGDLHGCAARPNDVCWPNVFTFSSGIVDGISGVDTGPGAVLQSKNVA